MNDLTKRLLINTVLVMSWMLLGSSDVLAAPSQLIVDVLEKSVTFHAVDGSRVEHKWPNEGIVYKSRRTSGAHKCASLQPGEHYQIVDLHDNKKRTFFLMPDAPMKNGVCLVGSA